MLNTFVVVTNVIGMIVITAIGVLTLLRMKSVKREYFVLFLLSTALFELGVIMETAASTVDGGLLGIKVGYIGAVLSAPLFLLFVQRFCDANLPRLLNTGLFLLAFLIMALVCTSEYHTLFYTSMWYDDVSPVHSLGVTRGIFYPLGRIHPLICVTLSVWLILRAKKNVSPERRKRVYFLLACVAAQPAAQLLTILNVEILGWDNFVLIFQVAAILLVYFGPARYEMLENEEILLVRKAFLQDMNHELRTPLAVIAANITYADKQVSVNGDMRVAGDRLKIAHDETLRVGRMLDGMLRVAAFSETAMNRRRLNFCELLEQSAGAFLPRLEKQGVKLRLEIDERLPDVYVERDKFIRVMGNLLSNAADHTRYGHIAIAAALEHPMISVSVTDTGEGISPELLPQLFERGVSGRDGTGYGLFICKRIVEAHGGSIRADSEPGKGTTIIFTVPVYGGQEAGHRR